MDVWWSLIVVTNLPFVWVYLADVELSRVANVKVPDWELHNFVILVQLGWW